MSKNNIFITDPFGNDYTFEELFPEIEQDIENFEKEIKQKIEDGYIDNDNKPLKCTCGCKEFETVNEVYDCACGGGTCEFDYQCTNCQKIVGTWSYGSWVW